MTVDKRFLKVEGTKIVDGNGQPVVLKGTASTALNLENFIVGFPGHETEHKKALLEAMGKEKFNFFFKKFYEYFWTDEDAKFLKSLNLNCLRIPFNYRHFLDDQDMSIIKPEGFELLDNIVDSCARNGIYTVLDLHAVPGGQNQDWHSDSGIHRALFWEFGDFQTRIVELWKAIAHHYKDNVWVAGYNPLNEPADPEHIRVVKFYERLEREIRLIDPNHILFLDANTYASDFSHFPDKPFPNTVYSIHDYTMFGFPAGEKYVGSETQKAKLRKNYFDKIEYMQRVQAPVWNGEFGPVYSSEVRGDQDIDETNAARYRVLRDQLEIYKSGDPSGDNAPISWSIWVYKDIGYQGLTYVSPNSKWFKVLGDFLLKKKKIGADNWGRDAADDVEQVFVELKKHVSSYIPEKYHSKLYPWSLSHYLDRVLRDILISQYLTYEYAEYFKDLSFEELDEMAASFKFENTQKREELNRYLAEY